MARAFTIHHSPKYPPTHYVDSASLRTRVATPGGRTRRDFSVVRPSAAVCALDDEFPLMAGGDRGRRECDRPGCHCHAPCAAQ